jgi:NhaP-type Na+/H+ and K+/H+ antiporter
VPSCVLLLCQHFYEIQIPGLWWAFALFCVANPVFIYALSLLFDNDAKASVLIRVSYFGLGSVAPLVQRVLYVINNPECWEWADWLKQFYVWAPIFNLCDVYISITK